MKTFLTALLLSMAAFAGDATLVGGNLSADNITLDGGTGNVSLDLKINTCIGFSGVSTALGATCNNSNGWVMLTDGALLYWYYGNQLRMSASQATGETTFPIGPLTSGGTVKSTGTGTSFLGATTAGNYVLKNNTGWGIWTNASDVQMLFDVGGVTAFTLLNNSPASLSLGLSTTTLKATDTKTSGIITLSGGTGTATVLSGVHCTCGKVTNASNGVICSVSSTTLTATGTNTDQVSYICL
jgi:hypothetical protein